jgi:hypothetical protein
VTSILTLPWGVFGEDQYNQWTVDGSIGASLNLDAAVKKVRVFRVISWIVLLIVEKDDPRNNTKHH